MPSCLTGCGTVHEVTDDEKFLFDLQGFLILRGAIEPDLVAALDQAVVANEAIEHDDSWAKDCRWSPARS